MNLRFDSDRNTVYIELTGAPDQATFLSTLDAVVAHPEYRKGMPRLWDLRNADLSSLTPQTIAEMARYSTGLAEGFGDVKVVFVTARALAFGFARMFEAYTRTQDARIGVFSTIEDAETWIVD